MTAQWGKESHSMRLINLEGDTNLTLQNQSAVKGQKLGLGPFLAWGDFYALAFRSLYYPWGKMGDYS